jgi:hypothetical protein
MSKSAIARRRLFLAVKPQTAADWRRSTDRELQKLREENQRLRQSAEFFGELAERLAAQLQKEVSQARRGSGTPRRRRRR